MEKIKFYDTLHKDCISIRTKVFIEEQGFKGEFDDTDEKAVHVVVYSDGIPCAVGRLFRSEHQDSVYKIGRVAVLKPYRGKKLGEKVILSLEDKCLEMGGKEIVLSAQCRVKEFYEKLGYMQFGEEFLDEHCPHINMRKYINEKNKFGVKSVYE